MTDQDQEQETKEEVKKDNLENLRSIVDDKDIIKEKKIEELSKKRESAIRNNLALGELVLECESILKDNLDKFKDDTNDERDFVKTLIEGVDIKSLRLAFSEYDYGNSIGDYQIKLRICEIVEEKRDSYRKLVNSFFEIFGGED